MSNEKQRKAYETLKEHEQLPTFEEYDNYFCLKGIDEEDITIEELLKKALEKIDKYADHLQGVLQPDTTIIAMTEANNYTQEEKKEVMEALKKLLWLHREGLRLQLNGNEKEKAVLINKITKTWKETLPLLDTIFTKMRDAWNTEVKETDEELYFG